jgi:hypothetical protein
MTDRYIVRNRIGRKQIGDPHTTAGEAERAALQWSKDSGYNVDVWLLDDAGMPKTKLAGAYRGKLKRTID